MGRNEGKAGSGQGVKVLERLMCPLSTLPEVLSLGSLSLMVPPGVLGLLKPEAGVASSPLLSPGRARFGSLLSVAGSSSIFLCFQPVLSHWDILNSSKTDLKKEGKKKKGKRTLFSSLLAAACSQGTEELKLWLGLKESKMLPSPGMCAGVEREQADHMVTPAPRDVPVLSTMADSFGDTINRWC